MASLDEDGAELFKQARSLPENRFASTRAQALSIYTGFVAQDIDAISALCVHRELLIIFRCPDFNANSYVAEVKDGSYWMKPCYIKQKTGEHGVLFFGGRAYVSDYDLLCVHRLNRETGAYEAVQLAWDGKSHKTAAEEEIIGTLNRRLIFKLQHGCNDNHVFKSADGRPSLPRNKNIGDEFLAFRGQAIDFVMGKSTLRSQFYGRYGLSGWHQAYGY
jgi:hypothetical protein